MMYCKQCGKDFHDDKKFCTECGAALEQKAQNAVGEKSLGAQPEEQKITADLRAETETQKTAGSPASDISGSNAGKQQQYNQSQRGDLPYNAQNQAYAPPQNNQQNNIPPAYAPPPVYNNQAAVPQTDKIVGTGTYFGLMFLFAIPVIGWLICIIMACGAARNPNVRNYARACLIWALIGIIIAALLALIGFIFKDTLVNYINGELANSGFTEWIQ